METQEFEHYFRLCLARMLTSEEARSYLFIVDEHADVEPEDDDLVMLYHEDEEGRHCYDVRLGDDITGDVGDDIARALEELFPEDDYECESSMDAISEEFIFDDLDLTNEDKQTLYTNYNRWNHQRWVDKMVEDGWHWGVKIDEQAKTHPNLRPSDDLLETYRPITQKSVEYVLEQLKEMGYKLVK